MTSRFQTVSVVLGLLTLPTQSSAASCQHLGQPCRSLAPVATCMVTDRADGRERLVLTNTNEAGLELIFLDFQREKATVFRSGDPKMTTGWAVMEVPGDRLVIATAGPSPSSGRLVIFDLRKMEFARVIPCGNESFTWTLALGVDGRVYTGSWPSGKLFALDLNTYQIEDLGAPGLPNVYLRNVSALPDGRIFCRCTFEKPMSIIYDPSTKKFEPAPEHIKDIERGVSWNGHFLTLGSVVCDGKTLAKVDPPFPVPDKGYWRFEPALTGGDTVFFYQGHRICRWSKGDKTVTPFAETDLRGGGLMARAKDGSVIGVRHQDYFVLKQGGKALNLKPIPAESSARPTFFLRVDPQGRIWGGAHFGQTVFWMDPKTGESHNTRAINREGGEVYDAAFHGGKPYFAAYTSGGIIAWDPEKPWDEYGDTNPKLLARAPGYIRPEAGITKGPDGKLYVGLMARYGTYGGAVLIFDPETGKSDFIENPLGDQGIASVAAGDGVLFVGTTCCGNGLPPRYNIPTRFGIIDLATRKTVFQSEPGGCAAIRALGWDPKSNRVVVALGKSLRLFDVKNRNFLPDACREAPELTCRSVGFAGGRLYYASGKSVVSLDVATGEAVRIVEAPADVSHVTVAPDGSIYFACGVDVYKVSR